jgi:tetratricopeptide (TPR) repeat protein
MNPRVNMKFVVLLSAGLIALATVVAYIAMKSISANAERSVTQGDKAMEAGDATTASKFYSRAVNKEQRNLEYIKKWLAALEKRTPTPRQVYEDAYRNEYMVALQALAEADRSNLENNRRLMQERYEWVSRGGGNLRAIEDFANAWESQMRSFTGDQKSKDILGRYRGLARAGMLTVNPDLSDDLVEGGIKDLDTAIAADPADGESMLAAAGMELNKARKLRERQTETTKAEALEKSGKARIAKLIATDSNRAPRAMFVNFELLMRERTQSSKNPAELAEVIKQSKAEVKAIVDRLMAQKPEDTDINATLSLFPFIQGSIGDAGETATALMEHVRKGHPEDATFPLAWANLELQRGNTAKAIELAKQVAALPDRPLSIQGLDLWNVRPFAVKVQADAAFNAWILAKDEADRKKWIDEIKLMRADLLGRVGEGDTRLLAIDGRIAFMNGDLAGARTIITQYNDQTQRVDREMLLLEGELLWRTGSNGAARQVLQRVLQLDRMNVRAMRALSEIEFADGNFPEAARLIAGAAQLMPDNEQLRTRATEMAGWATGKTDDPVTKCFREARELSMGVTADIPGAAAKLRSCLKDHPGEPRLVLALVQLSVGMNDAEGAKQVINDAVAKNPNNPQFKELKRRIDADNPVDLMEQALQGQAGMNDAQKNIIRYQTFKRLGKLDDARAALAAAAKSDPDDQAVLDAQFQEAMATKNMAELRRIEQIAQTRNLDRAGGQIYKGLREIIENKIEDAAGTFRSVVEKDKLNQIGWRMLGVTCLDLNRFVDAEAALLKAVEIKSDDVASITAYIRALVAQNKITEARDFARKNENFAVGDPDFVEMLVTLEALPGGNNEKAITARQRLAERLPKDSVRYRANQQQLASLLINAQRFDEAKKIIAALRAADPKDMTAVELEAGLLGRQGDVAGAVKLYQDALESIPEAERKPLPYINAGRLMLQLGDATAATAMLEKGRKYQDPETMIVDREIGDMMFNAGKLDESIAAYKRVLDGKTKDEGRNVAKRIFEAQIRLKKFDDFNTAFAKIPELERDSTLLLLAAESAIGENDREKARRFYDQAVQADNKNFLVYIKRADFNWDDPKYARDVEADLEQALRVAPNAPLVRVRRAKWFSKPDATGVARDDLALQELQQAVSADPSNEQLRLGLAEKFRELGKLRERAQVLDDGVKESKGNPAWRGRAADAWGLVGEWSRAVEHWEAVWAQRKNVEIANFLADAYLNTNSPKDLQSAAAILAAPEVIKDQSFPTRMLRARLLHRQGRIADAVNEIASIYSALDQTKFEDTSIFLGGLSTIYNKPADLFSVLDKLEERSKFKSWMAFLVASNRIRQDAAKPKAIAAFEALTTNSAEPRLQGLAWSMLGSTSFQAGKFDDAAAQFAKGLALDKDNAELNNNLAYTYAVKLNKGAEGIPYAEKAVQLAPVNSGFRDTLGVAYLAAGRHSDAERELRQALDMALNDAERAPVFIHLGKARLAQGDKAEARRRAGAARDLLQKDSNARAVYDADLQELERQIDAQ